jgi:hypothetical protein
MAGEKLLSETQCKNAKPKAKVYYLNDGGGLRLRCRPGLAVKIRIFHGKAAPPWAPVTWISTLKLLFLL